MKFYAAFVCRRWGLGLILAALATLSRAVAQTPDVPQVFFDAVPFAAASMDTTRADLYCSVPYNILLFERESGKFTARYTAHFKVVKSDDGRVVYDSTFSRVIRTRSYEISTGAEPGFDFYQQVLMLAPNQTYMASLDMSDGKSGVVTSSKRELTTINYRNFPFALSGLLLVAKVREDSTGYSITPLLSENVGSSPDGYFLFFESYNSTSKTKFRVTATYRLPNGTPVSSQSFDKTFSAGRTQQWVHLPGIGVARGAYIVELRAAAADDTVKTLATAQRTVRFENQFDGMPGTPDELDEKIAQLRYVASQSQIDNIRQADNFADKRKRFTEFWATQDPTPGTGQNEAMQDYYRRVQYANERFRSYAAGWLTDKGHVYIVFGPPDNAATDPFRNNGKAVETWQYYGRNLRFVFLDETGFGDFRLSTPFPAGEKYRYQ